MVLGFLPSSCAISAQRGCFLPWSPWGPARAGGGGKGSNCLLCLPPSSLLSDGAALLCPVFWGRFVFLLLGFFYILKLKCLAQPPPCHPHIAVNLSVKNAAVHFQPLLLPYP